MKLESQVCSLGLAKRLKELGVKQESLFWWCPGEMDYGYEGEWSIRETEEEKWFIFDHVVGYDLLGSEYSFDWDNQDWGDTDAEFEAWEKRKKKAIKSIKLKVCSAFTVAELELPWGLMSGKNQDGKFFAQALMGMAGKFAPSKKLWEITRSDTEADARAKLLIYLIENNLYDQKAGKN